MGWAITERLQGCRALFDSIGTTRAGGKRGRQPSMVRFPIGIHASPSAIARYALAAWRKRNGLDLRSGVAQPAFARYALQMFLAPSAQVFGCRCVLRAQQHIPQRRGHAEIALGMVVVYVVRCGPGTHQRMPEAVGMDAPVAQSVCGVTRR